MSEHQDNCVVQTISWLLKMPPENVVAEIAKYPGPNDEPAFTERGSCFLLSYGGFLESLGWKFALLSDFPAGTLPARGLFGVDDHVFALSGGRLFDVRGGNYFGDEILDVFVPPSSERETA